MVHLFSYLEVLNEPIHALLTNSRAYPVHPSGISVPTQSSRSQPDNGNLRNQQPPSKRRRNEDWGRTLDSAISVGGQIPESNSSQISSLTPESPGWMRVRITKLEAELDTLRAARDMAVSEQNIIRTAHQAEQTARREAMAQKSAAEAALSRKEVEQGRLRAELDSALSQKEALSAEVDSLRRQLAAPEDRLKSIQSSSESTRSNEQIKTLETGLEDAQGRAHKLQLYGSHMEEKQETNDTTELDKMKTKVKRLKSEVKQLTSDLVTTQEQLESAQKSLESKERKCSSTRRRYENTKTKLGIYKARLENECALIQKLKETLTPAAYQSLGETHETLGAFLSAIGLPPVDEEGNGAPKEETQ
ncbi:unnamed protein product [Rhizoctonia solani]|uniref:Uncharacterized protein n=1 Tax=Rhizoctonia solani TaxID=456999 RepID=A0A8H3HB06_9AGAM|nr:unnamed protein product [Rhizoctonia solani]